MKVRNWFLVLLSVLVLSFGCENKAPKGADGSDTDSSALKNENPMEKEANNINWVSNAVIYEVNVRQYTPEGTFSAFEKKLPQLQELGVDILWFMPIHPIGMKNRKEDSTSMGSYYAVRDYKGVNPDFGTLEEFKVLVKTCHDMGFKVVLDWVANHSAPDNHWVDEHPDWYTKDEEGNSPIPPMGTDWWDVADLDYTNQEMRNAMIDALKFWVDECDIDGYRCDVAGEVPLDFWLEARPQIEENKKLFMLAEWEDPEFYKAFDFMYAWHLNHTMTAIYKGEETVKDLVEMSCEDAPRWLNHELEFETWGPYNHQMNFTTNHDENSWKENVIDRLGESNRMWAALSFMAPGLPLIYSGQEVGNDKTLLFFDKDEIDWTDRGGYFDFYKGLVKMKHENTALWVGENGASFESFKIDDENLYAFYRKGNADALIAFFNMSAEAQTFALPENEHLGEFGMTAGDELTLEPWSYKVETIKTTPDGK